MWNFKQSYFRKYGLSPLILSRELVDLYCETVLFPVIRIDLRQVIFLPLPFTACTESWCFWEVEKAFIIPLLEHINATPTWCQKEVCSSLLVSWPVFIFGSGPLEDVIIGDSVNTVSSKRLTRGMGEVRSQHYLSKLQQFMDLAFSQS